MRALPALLLLALMACGGPGPTEWQYSPGAIAPDYQDALKDWTRSAETYEYFESRVFVKATWFSPAFAAAHARYRAQRLGLSPAEAEAALAAALASARQEVRIFAAVVTNDSFWNDMHRPGGTLRPTLRVGDDVVEANRVEKLTDNEMADLRPFFPYVNDLTTGYWLVFPLPEDVRLLHLRIAGPPAVIDLAWETR